jgi:hypothetical protein
MELFAIVFAVVALVLVGVGIAIGLVGIALTALLVALGVVSSSVALGWRSGKASVGLRAFFLQCGVVLGLPAGAVCAYLAHSFFKAYGEGWPVIVYGAIAGAFAGVIIALSVDFVSRRVQQLVAARLPSIRRAQPPSPIIDAEPAEAPMPRPRRSGILR